MVVDVPVRRRLLARFATGLANLAPFQQYFLVSPVSLGIGRIYLGLLLLLDLGRRWADLDIWYTNAGLMPNHTMLWRPQAQLSFSLFFSVSELHEARFFFGIFALIFGAFLVGFKTRLMHALSAICVASLNCRVHYLTNGGDVALSVLLLWTWFLPMGRWLSVDAFLKKMKHSRLQLSVDGVAELQKDPLFPGLFESPRPIFERAFCGLLLQLAVIYFFNFVHKDGSGWVEGRVFHDVLHQDRIVTRIGLLVRPYITPRVSEVFTQVVLKIELLLPVLLLLPVKSVWIRRVTVLLGVMLHIGMALFINLGIFSATMVGFFLLLIPHEDMVRVVRWLGKTKHNATLYFDSDCGVCTRIAKMLLCLHETSVQPRPFILRMNRSAPADTGVTMERVHESILWVDSSGRYRWKARALAEIIDTIPLLRPFAWMLRFNLADRVYQAFAARRQGFSEFLGLGTCGITQKVEPFGSANRFQRSLRQSGNIFRQLLLAYVAAAFVVQVLAQNRAVPKRLKLEPPFWTKVVVEYGHFFQGWGMFAESPRHDETVVVRAWTIDGRQIDPLSERAARVSPLGDVAIPERLDHSEFFCDYISRIAHDPPYHAPLRDWLLAYPQRTGNPKDELVSFEVVLLTDLTPSMGQSTPTERQERIFIKYPES